MIKACGKTHAFSVANSSHTAVQVGLDVNDGVSKAAFFNSGSTVVAVRMSTDSTNGPATFPSDGTPSGSIEIVLPASMTAPVVFATPTCPFYLTAIGSAAGPSIIYVTPCEE